MQNVHRHLLLLTAGILFVSMTTKAQGITANVTLNVVLQNTSSITIGGGFQTATLTYDDASDYQNGVTLAQTGALTAVSNQPYSITVYAGTNLLNGANSIPAGGVTVTPSLAASNGNITLTGQAIPVGSTNAATIITSSEGTTSQAYNLTYSTASAPTADFINKPSGTYTTTLTYTITNP